MAETPMVEKVARAICLSSNGNPDRIHPFAMGERDVPEWRLDVDEARAAIQAMRGPPDSMCVPGGLAIEDALFAENKLVFDGARDCFNAMLDAALAVPDEGQSP